MDCLNDALLPENTKKLWATICSKPVARDFSGFILVGGTALSLRIGHRISEDLDFVWAHSHPATHYDTLPRQAIDKAMYHLRNDFGFHVEKISYPAEEDDFINDGLNLDDFHQDYIVGGTKVTFFKASPDAFMALGCTDDKSCDDPLRVATLHEVFLLKSLVVTERAKTRDYFDLYTLLKACKCNLQDAYDVISKSSTINGWDIFSERLSSLPVRKDDEGYHQMLDGEDSPSLEDMREFFRSHLSQYGIRLKNRVIEENESSHTTSPQTLITHKMSAQQVSGIAQEESMETQQSLPNEEAERLRAQWVPAASRETGSVRADDEGGTP